LPSELTAAFLYAQLEKLDEIQNRRKEIWNAYWEGTKGLEERGICLPSIPDYATNNAHMFYLVLSSLEDRTAFIQGLREKGIMAVFHYQSLHLSEFYKDENEEGNLQEVERYSDCLVRLPLFLEVNQEHLVTSIANQKVITRKNL
jgi:dTDP-4-amino-4,6-dideoxygalactose transaminase